MPLGAYSLVRFSNNLNDQRVNLGVILWHPTDGFDHRFSSSLDRAQAVDRRVRLKELKKELELIKSELGSAKGSGEETLTGLSKVFVEGVEVTAPYPAKIQSLQDLERLYELLVSSEPEIRRASSQYTFERKLLKVLPATFLRINPKGDCKDLGTRAVNGVQVRVGVRTVVGKHAALWRALSLQAKDRAEDQIAEAKATALDILTVKSSFKEFKKARQIVVLQPPKPKANERLSDSMAWLKHEADDIVLVQEIESLPPILEQKLRELEEG